MNKFSSLLICAALLTVTGCASLSNSVKEDATDAVATPSDVNVVIVDESGNPYPAAIQQDIKQKFKAAVTLSKNKQWEEAEQRFTELQQDYPHLSGSYTNLAMIAFQKKDLKTALQLIDRSLTINEIQPDAWVFKGILARESGDFDMASQWYAKAIELDNHHSDAILNLAILNDLYLGDLGKATEYYERYQQEEQEDKRVKNWLLDIKRRIADYD